MNIKDEEQMFVKAKGEKDMAQKFNDLCNKKHRMIRVTTNFASGNKCATVAAFMSAMKNDSQLCFRSHLCEMTIDLDQATQMIITDHPIRNFDGKFSFANNVMIEVLAVK